ncbi:MAG: bifunctional 4-hydroxy-2-oxoglutarate aldolase/2-dehydro-3-deoxy-phosphogluconate aldolase [Hyphomicrobiaceae bacterium]|nr:bifunctional 4-hydroxy-2-oxoglutarate aldolase/2-dehydro-3-deoxy-phosphogluconate aldolase [Hyphomicrobiaceae bacterium]
MTLASRLAALKVVPVVSVPSAARAVELAQCLRDAGLGVIELTLRTAAGLAAIEAIARAVPEILLGAGSVRTSEQARASIDAGAAFLVAPAFNPAVSALSNAAGIAYLPGTATPTEMETAAGHGHRFMKLFPAEVVGGKGLLKAVHGPMPDLTFCPTGGITAATARSYLDLPNVVCVGGSWIATDAAIRDGDWTAIGANARAVADL